MSQRRNYDYSRAMTKMMPTEVVTKKQLALETGKSLSTIRRMVYDGRLPEPLRTPKGCIGGWFRETINQWLKDHSPH